jgi:hypothetical protein
MAPLGPSMENIRLSRCAALAFRSTIALTPLMLGMPDKFILAQ